MIDISTVGCVILGSLSAFFAYRQLTDPETMFEEMFGYSTHDPIQLHYVAVEGGYLTFVAITLVTLGLFQPSSNARIFALVSYSIVQLLITYHHYRMPVRGQDHPPESLLEMPLPMLLGQLCFAVACALGSRTDAQRKARVQHKKQARSKLQAYAQHAAPRMSKKD